MSGRYEVAATRSRASSSDTAHGGVVSRRTGDFAPLHAKLGGQPCTYGQPIKHSPIITSISLNLYGCQHIKVNIIEDIILIN